MTLRKCAMASFAISFLLFTTGCDKDDMDTPVVKPDIIFYALTSSNQLVKYNANSETSIATVAVTGLQAAENLLAIDFRPATGQLYGVGSTSRLYIINQENGKATAVGTTSFTPAVTGTLVGFDFNPTVDRIRLVTSAGQNLRLNPETGTVAATDVNLNPGSPSVSSVAYTNSVAGASSTVLFDIDIASGKLFKQDPPNNGTLVEIGSLGVNSANESSFDISPDNTVALASFNVAGSSGLYQIELTTGKATKLGNLGATVIGIAIPTNPVAYAVDDANNLLIFNFKSPGTPVSKAITGLQIAETILGIDMRPATGQLYALGSSSRIYTINMSSGAATAVGGGPFTPLLTGTAFGFDFNPTVDRIRVVSNAGQNLRLNPIDGTIAAVDAPLNPGTPMVSAAAYINNFPGSTATVLFDIDASTDKLYTQNPPNNGTLVEVAALGVNIDESNGFDVGGTTNNGYGLFRVGGVAKIYTVNLTTASAATPVDFPIANVKGFAVGLGF